MDAWQQWLKRWFTPRQEQSPATGEPARKGQSVLLLVVLGVVLLLLARLDLGSDQHGLQNAGVALPTVRRTEGEGWEEQLEERLVRLLQAMQGVGDVEVMVTLDQSARQVFAVERTEERTYVQGEDGRMAHTVEERLTERPILLREDQGRTEKPMIVTSYEPRVRGVVVLAQGAYDPTLRYEISRLVQTVFGIAAHQVHVYTKE